MKKYSLLAAISLLLFSCRDNRQPAAEATGRTSVNAALQPALASFTPAAILAHTQVLASDAYEGRAPGTRGEDSTIAYLTRQFKKLGLAPGNPNGTYIQDVPLYGYTAQPTASFTAQGKKIDLEFPTDYVALSHRYQPQVNVTNSDLVFVGYGIVAPEYGWDDYKNVDVRGKTIVMLVNDPPIPDPNDTTQLDAAQFGGRAMTYYGRWTYKYEIATEKGAAAAIIIHETGPAGYPYEVISGSWSRENVDIQTADKNASQVAVKSWITTAKAQELFTAAGQNFAALKQAARQKDFRPVVLPAKVNFNLKMTLRELKSRNVIGKIEGSDPQLKNEYVVYTAHWDHLGKDPKLTGDQIYNGALDNATGTAGLLELAAAYQKLPVPPKRTILFLAVTAEEKGLLGSKYYAANPLYPLNKTLANLNMDGLNAYGRTKDVIIIGYGNSTLDDILARAAQTQRREIRPEATPEKGSFYRSDHFEFAKQGVPALYAKSGEEALNKPPGYLRQKAEAYTARDYHKVTDEVKADWNFSGAVEDLQLYFRVGYDVAQGETYPTWKPGTEFKAKREATLLPR